MCWLEYTDFSPINSVVIRSDSKGISWMAPQDDSCSLNMTEADIRDEAFTSGVSGIVCLLFSLMGLAVEIIFIVCKKNTFLLRLIVYLSLSALAVVGSQALHILIYL